MLNLSNAFGQTNRTGEHAASNGHFFIYFKLPESQIATTVLVVTGAGRIHALGGINSNFFQGGIDRGRLTYLSVNFGRVQNK